MKIYDLCVSLTKKAVVDNSLNDIHKKILEKAREGSIQLEYPITEYVDTLMPNLVDATIKVLEEDGFTVVKLDRAGVSFHNFDTKEYSKLLLISWKLV
jgi:hypothetical protein